MKIKVVNIIITAACLLSQAFTTLPAQISYVNNFQTSTGGAKIGGTPASGSSASTGLQINVETSINNYDYWPLLKLAKKTSITGIPFASFYYEFDPEDQEINTVHFSATGGSCFQAGNRIYCNGYITDFFLSYNYSQELIPRDNLLVFKNEFVSEGLNFNGNFKITYRADLMKFHSASVPTQSSFPNILTWHVSNTASAKNIVTLKLICVLINYISPHFKGDPIVTHIDFISTLNKIDQATASAQVRLWITDSYSEDTIHADRSSHKIGHAIDMNVDYGPNFSKRCTWKNCFKNAKNTPNLPPQVLQLIKLVQASGVRWGGNPDSNFPYFDPVHFDDDKIPVKYWDKQRKIILSNLGCSLGRARPTP